MVSEIEQQAPKETEGNRKSAKVKREKNVKEADRDPNQKDDEAEELWDQLEAAEEMQGDKEGSESEEKMLEHHLNGARPAVPEQWLEPPMKCSAPLRACRDSAYEPGKPCSKCIIEMMLNPHLVPDNLIPYLAELRDKSGMSGPRQPDRPQRDSEGGQHRRGDDGDSGRKGRNDYGGYTTNASPPGGQITGHRTSGKKGGKGRRAAAETAPHDGQTPYQGVGRVVCCFYARKGFCRFGQTCDFAHWYRGVFQNNPCERLADSSNYKYPCWRHRRFCNVDGLNPGKGAGKQGQQ